jgi:hypothetical protein
MMRSGHPVIAARPIINGISVLLLFLAFAATLQTHR